MKWLTGLVRNPAVAAAAARLALALLAAAAAALGAPHLVPADVLECSRSSSSNLAVAAALPPALLLSLLR